MDEFNSSTSLDKEDGDLILSLASKDLVNILGLKVRVFFVQQKLAHFFFLL